MVTAAQNALRNTVPHRALFCHKLEINLEIKSQNSGEL